MELASTFEIVATAKLGHTAEELLKVIDEELVKLRTSGVKEDEIARGKTGIVSNILFEAERSTSRANGFNTYNHFVGDPNYLAQDLARTTNATTETVANAARTWLKEKDRVVTLVTPRKDAPMSGKVVSKKVGAK